MDLRSRLSYANVAATLALVLAIGSGTVYAALQLGKNEVKSRNIAKGAVKTSDLHTNAVTGEKVKEAALTGGDLQDGTITGGDVQDETLTGGDVQDGSLTGGDVQNASITGDDIAAGVIPQIEADVTGSATGGPQGGVNTNATTPLQLSGKTSFTPGPGEVSAIVGEVQFTLATTNVLNQCSPTVFVTITGQQTGLFLNPDGNVNSTTLVQAFGRDADGPYGLLSPGTPVSFTAELIGDTDCTASSQLDRVEIRILQIK